MKESRYRIIKSILAAAVSVLMLTACNGAGDDVYWEDTLPSAAVRTEAEIVIITEDTPPPISIEMPETTTVSAETRDTELATTTTTVTVPTTTVTTTAVPDSSSDTSISTVSGVPTVVLPEFTSPTTTGVSATKVTTGTSETKPSASVDTAHVSELTGETLTEAESHEFSVRHTTMTYDPEATSLSLETGSNGEGDVPYVFNDPIQAPYCAGTLEGDKKKAYDLMVKAMKKQSSRVSFPDGVDITAEDYCELYQMIYNSEHTIYYIDTQMKYTTNVKTNRIVSAELCYIYTADEVNSMQKKIDAAADKIKNGITENMTEYDIVKHFFDNLVMGCVYDLEAENCRDLYGCLVNGRAVCGGYAKSFSYLCDSVGIQSLTITGDFDGTPHMWNMVQIGGDWYHIDVTAGVVSNTDEPYIRYDYFCVTDEISGRTHVVYDQPYTYPEAKADKYNYYVYNNLVAHTVDEAVELVNMGILSAAESGSHVIQIACATDEVFEDTVYALFDKTQAKALILYENAFSKAAKKYNRESIVYNQEKDTRVIKLFLDYLD
ncbi:MAG: hypothetical protein IJZ72_09125 [Oscillospiraceae bacterium]|nr:hypothetical protein [Oscillospiraceae bacterium]